MISFDITDVSGELQLTTDWQMTEAGIYLVLAGNFSETDLVGNGIYYLPFYTPEEVESFDPIVAMDTAHIVKVDAVPYKEGDTDPHIRISGDKNRLLLYTQEGNRIMMTSYDVKTGKLLEKQEVLPQADGITVDVYEDYQIVFGMDSGCFTLLEQDETCGI